MLPLTGFDFKIYLWVPKVFRDFRETGPSIESRIRICGRSSLSLTGALLYAGFLQLKVKWPSSCVNMEQTT